MQALLTEGEAAQALRLRFCHQIERGFEAVGAGFPAFDLDGPEAHTLQAHGLDCERKAQCSYANGQQVELAKERAGCCKGG